MTSNMPTAPTSSIPLSPQVTDSRYYFLPSPPPHSALFIPGGGRERCRPDYHIDRKNFSCYAVEFVADGAGTLELQGTTYDLRPGTVFSYGPRTSCRIRNNPAKPLLKYFVDFGGRQAAALLRETPLDIGEAVVPVFALNTIMDIFERLYAEGARNNPTSHDLCLLYLRELLIRITEASIPAQAGAGRAYHRYQEIRNLIDKAYLKLHSVADAAAAAHTDVSHLCRLFQRFGGISAYEYLTRLKMSHAVDLLLGTDLLVKEIADQVGYPDPFHFSRRFRSLYGLSPEQFRVQRQRI